MKKINQIVSITTAAAILFDIFTYKISAKVIEPEIIKTESWTTSYFIDDDMETLYPYIQCEADIYNDGTIKLYMWNTHEWDGFTTSTDIVSMQYSDPISCDSDYYKTLSSLSNNEEDFYGFFFYKGDGLGSKNVDYDSCSIYIGRNDLIKISSFPSNYKKQMELPFNSGALGSQIGPLSNRIEIMQNTYPDSSIPVDPSPQKYPHVTGKVQSPFRVLSSNLASMTFSQQNPIDKNASGFDLFEYRDCLKFTFTPIEILSTQTFSLYGHDITITPELLSGSIDSQPVKTEAELLKEQIAELQAELDQLKAENKELRDRVEYLTNAAGDVDSDGVITLSDALLTLQYYSRKYLFNEEDVTWEKLLA